MEMIDVMVTDYWVHRTFFGIHRYYFHRVNNTFDSEHWPYGEWIL